MTKLRNNEAVRRMLDGTHRTQTKNTLSFSGTDNKDEVHFVGEVWKDKDGIEWEQRAGFKIKKGKLDEIRNKLAEKHLPSHCPSCKQPMKKKLDAKFWKLEGRCLDCQIDFEHQLRIEGKFEKYENDRILKNAEAWLKEAEQESKELANVFRNPLQFAGADGVFENWSGGLTGEEIASKIEEEFELFKENFIKKLKTK
jgi:ribosomal protein L37AE/L43A